MAGEGEGNSKMARKRMPGKEREHNGTTHNIAHCAVIEVLHVHSGIVAGWQ